MITNKRHLTTEQIQEIANLTGCPIAMDEDLQINIFEVKPVISFDKKYWLEPFFGAISLNITWINPPHWTESLIEPEE